MARPTVLCLSCGTRNDRDRERCSECGAKVVSLGDDVRRGAERAGFAIGWFSAALVAYSLALAISIVGLPFVLRSYDPQGLAGLLIAIAIWFVGGVVVGGAAGDRRVLEPSVAATVTAGAIIPYIAFISDVRALGIGAYVSGGILGALAAFLGAFFGDRFSPKGSRA